MSKSRAVIERTPQLSSDEKIKAGVSPLLAQKTPPTQPIAPLSKNTTHGGQSGKQPNEPLQRMATFTTVGLLELEKAGLIKRYAVRDREGGSVVKIVLAFDMEHWTETLELR